MHFFNVFKHIESVNNEGEQNMENFKLQHKVQLFTQYFGTQTSPEHRLLDLTSEIGELSKEILKQTNYGKHEFTPSDDWSEELGDVFLLSYV